MDAEGTIPWKESVESSQERRPRVKQDARTEEQFSASMDAGCQNRGVITEEAAIDWPTLARGYYAQINYTKWSYNAKRLWPF